MPLVKQDGSPLEGHTIPVRRLSPRDAVSVHTSKNKVHEGIVATERGSASRGHEAKTVKLTASELPSGHSLEVKHRRGDPPRLQRVRDTERGQTIKQLGRIEKIVLNGHVPLDDGGDN